MVDEPNGNTNADPNIDVSLPHDPDGDGLDPLLHCGFARPGVGPPSVLEKIRSVSGVKPQRALQEPGEEGECGQHLGPEAQHRIPRTGSASSRYETFAEIGRGGMGRILHGRDTDLGRDVAMKVLLPRSQENPALVQRFIEEAQIGGQLQHPGIVPVYELGMDQEDQPFFTMKLVKGRTLATLLAEREDTGLDRSRFLSIFEKICQTIAYAHARGVIHRDLKPSNVMVGAFGEVLIMDWGLAKVLDRGKGVGDAVPGEVPVGNAADAGDAVVGEGAIDALDEVRPPSDRPGSLGGSIFGTPAYMPPEQARGEIRKLDQRSDVFSLGAILCEILTSKAPYEGEDSATIREQAAEAKLEEAFTRLDECSADAELVQLTRECLHPKRAGRPKDAGALSERISAHIADVDERSRKAELAAAEAKVRTEEAQARMVQERRARKLAVALAAVVVAALAIGGGAYLWIRNDRQARTLETLQEVNEALAEARELRSQAQAGGEAGVSKLAGALAIAHRAELRARSDSGSPELLAKAQALVAAVQDEEQQARQAQEQAKADRGMLERLEDIHLQSYDQNPNKSYDKYDWNREDAAYASAFRKYGIDVDCLEPEEAVRLIQESSISMDLVFALRFWSGARKNCKGEDPKQLPSILRQVRSGPWGEVLANEADLKTLQELARSNQLKSLPPRWLSLLAWSLARKGDMKLALQLHQEAQDLYPQHSAVHSDYGYFLNNQLKPPRLVEAAGCYRTALALRPQSPVLWHHLAWTLIHLGEKDRPLAYLHRVAKLKPKLAWAHYELAGGYSETGDPKTAVGYYRGALELKPDFAEAHLQLGVTLLELGDLEPAIEHFRKVTDLRPDEALGWANLGAALVRRSDPTGALEACRRAINLAPDIAGFHYNLGMALEKRGDLKEAVKAYRKASELDPQDADTHERLAHVLRAVGNLKGAIQSFHRAVEIEPQRIAARGWLGIALMENGDLERSIECFQEVLRIQPKVPVALVNLGIALRDLGRYEEALRHFEKLEVLGVGRVDWPKSPQQLADDCRHLAKIELQLPEFLRGERKPADLEEQLLIGRVCRVRKMHFEAARMFREAFAHMEGQSRQSSLEYRYDAARSAALVGCGWKQGSLSLDSETRADWRMWALEQLRQELPRWNPTAKGEHVALRRNLKMWKDDPELRGIREKSALAALGEAEGKAWRALWAEVDALLERAR